MLIFCSGIPVFAVITKVDKSELSTAMVKDIENRICSTLCISSNHVLLFNNYQCNHIPDIAEDITILEFLNKVNQTRLTFTIDYVLFTLLCHNAFFHIL